MAALEHSLAVSQKCEHTPAYGPAPPLLGVSARETKACAHTQVFICNNPKLSISGWMNKQHPVYTYCMLLLSSRQEWTIGTSNDVTRMRRKIIMPSERSQTKMVILLLLPIVCTHILYQPIYVKTSRKCKRISSDSKHVGRSLERSVGQREELEMGSGNFWGDALSGLG